MTEPRVNPAQTPPGRPTGIPAAPERVGVGVSQDLVPPAKPSNPGAVNARHGIWLMFFGLFLFALLVTSHHIIAGSVALVASLAAGTMIVLLFKDRD